MGLDAVINGLADAGIAYQGVIYAGMMITRDGPKVLEFNCRFGDPETQPVLMRLESDLVEIMEAVVDRRLHEQEIVWSNNASVCIVIASGGYPGNYEKGEVIMGIDQVTEAEVFHAGTRFDGGEITTNGGRVLGVTALGKSIGEAIRTAYAAVEKIDFTGMQYRKDIGQKALAKKRD